MSYIPRKKHNRLWRVVIVLSTNFTPTPTKDGTLFTVRQTWDPCIRVAIQITAVSSLPWLNDPGEKTWTTQGQSDSPSQELKSEWKDADRDVSTAELFEWQLQWFPGLKSPKLPPFLLFSNPNCLAILMILWVFLILKEVSQSCFFVFAMKRALINIPSYHPIKLQVSWN